MDAGGESSHDPLVTLGEQHRASIPSYLGDALGRASPIARIECGENPVDEQHVRRAPQVPQRTPRHRAGEEPRSRRVGARRRFARDPDAASVGAQEPGDTEKERALPRARSPDDPHDLPALGAERHPVERPHLDATSTEPGDESLPELEDLQERASGWSRTHAGKVRSAVPVAVIGILRGDQNSRVASSIPLSSRQRRWNADSRGQQAEKGGLIRSPIRWRKSRSGGPREFLVRISRMRGARDRLRSRDADQRDERS